MQKLIGQLKTWWVEQGRQRLLRRLTRSLREGTGVHQSAWRLGCVSDTEFEGEIAAWLNEIITTSRRPYGITAFRVGQQLIAEDRATVLADEWGQQFRFSDYGKYKADLVGWLIRKNQESPDKYLRVTVLALGDVLRATVFAD